MVADNRNTHSPLVDSPFDHLGQHAESGDGDDVDVANEQDLCGICRDAELDLSISLHSVNIDLEASVCIDSYTDPHQLIEPVIEEEIGDEPNVAE